VTSEVECLRLRSKNGAFCQFAGPLSPVSAIGGQTRMSAPREQPCSVVGLFRKVRLRQWIEGCQMEEAASPLTQLELGWLAFPDLVLFS
jgi:hypothetical protein